MFEVVKVFDVDIKEFFR